jgi:hypothetical protein
LKSYAFSIPENPRDFPVFVIKYLFEDSQGGTYHIAYKSKSLYIERTKNELIDGK